MAIGRQGLARVAMLLALAFTLGTPDASAASRICRQLEAQLASAGSGGGGGAQFRKYDKAVAKQRDQLSKARSNARRAGCRFSLFGGNARCGAVNTQIERMERNLEALERKRTELAGGGGGISRRERTRILASIEANGCRDPEQRVVERRLPPPLTVRTREGASLFDQLFGGGVRRDGEYEEALGRPLNDYGDGTYGPSGHFRTICVRTCDGYYFPMSGGSSGRDFGRDQQNCESMCPGTDIQLYYHDATGEESEQMVSASTGEPYTALSTAYRYKQIGTERPAGCGCSPVKNFALLGDGAAEAPEAEPVIPTPVGRPDPGANPETLANAEGGLDAAAIGRILRPKPVVAIEPSSDPADRKVRVVGPVFLPDQAGAIDLRTPGQKKVQ